MSCQRRQTDKQFPTDGTEVYLIMYYLFSVENKLRRDTTVYSLRSCWGCVYEQILNKHSIVKTRTSRVQTKANSRPTNVNQSNLIKSDLKCSFRVHVHARKTNQTAWKSVHYSNFSPGSAGRTKAGEGGLGRSGFTLTRFSTGYLEPNPSYSPEEELVVKLVA